jgi:hypothetical protein
MFTFLLYLTCNQIWLFPLVDGCHCDKYITKLGEKKNLSGEDDMHSWGRRKEVACRRSILAAQDESILVWVQENEGRRFFFPLQESHWRPYSHRNPHSFHHCKQAIKWDKSKLARVDQRTQCPFLQTNKLCKKKLDKKPFFDIPSREKSGETSDESKFQNQQNIGNLDLQGNPGTK